MDVGTTLARDGRVPGVRLVVTTRDNPSRKPRRIQVKPDTHPPFARHQREARGQPTTRLTKYPMKKVTTATPAPISA
jgi:hypothetical protein